MPSIEVVENKISDVRKYLAELNRFKELSLADIESDRDKKAALERYLHLALEATINTAQALIAMNKLRKPTSLSESFEILRENNVIDEDLEDRMSKMVGFRNILVHDYEDLNYKIVMKTLKSNLDDIEEFIYEVEDFLEDN